MPSVPSAFPILPGATFKEPETPMPPVPSTFPVPPAAMFRGPATPAPVPCCPSYASSITGISQAWHLAS